MKEYELFLKYDTEVSYNNKAYNAFDLIKSAISNRQIEMLDIELCTSAISEVMYFLGLKKKYISLKNIAGEKLSFGNEGFSFYDSTFATLEEVERAMKLKAFI